MPTKINSAGKQQNYVPAGNGDASGEYGDNATGSNKNFKVFKKPDDNSSIGIEKKMTNLLNTMENNMMKMKRKVSL